MLKILRPRGNLFSEEIPASVPTRRVSQLLAPTYGAGWAKTQNKHARIHGLPTQLQMVGTPIRCLDSIFKITKRFLPSKPSRS